ncbi:MAG: hypothetical protein HY237_11915 [Acidobacteria bacterium]|nr:hypothetical protein [Acidobacteriota bacterium]
MVPFCLAILAGLLPGVAHAQLPYAPPTACKQLWDEASAQAAQAAQEKASLAAGAAPSAAASRWAQAWTQAWIAPWTAPATGLQPSRADRCCDSNWFELAAQTGKAGWVTAWKAAGGLSGPDKAWAEKYADSYAGEWAREWFVSYPWLCAMARAKAQAERFRDRARFSDATADAWAWAWADLDVWAQVRASVWTEVWTKAGSAAWAKAGAEAMTAAAASAESTALAAVSGNCALAAASACARAAAAAYAAAWAAAGSSAYSSAYAEASAEAMARAFAEAWAGAMSGANAEAFAAAYAKAFAKAGAKAFAAVWRLRLADEGQLSQIVKWWKTPGVPQPPFQSIWKLLAAARAEATKKAVAEAWAIAWAEAPPAFASDFKHVRSYVYEYLHAWTSSWVNSWTESWAYAWARAWAEAYALACSRAAAVACAQCPPCTTTTTTGRPRTIERPSGFTYTLVGLGVTAGSIIQIVVRNTTGEPIVVEVPAGTVFKPSDPQHQRMVISEDQRVTVPSNQTTQAPLQGYCLDYGKLPPPPTTLGALATEPVLVAALDPRFALSSTLGPQAPGGAVKYQLDENPAAYAPFLRIIESGNRLAGEGKFHTDLPPDKHKLAVIQRALWTYATRNTPTPHTRETLLADIRRQVKESGGTQTEEQIQELVTHIAEDIESVLRAAERK